MKTFTAQSDDWLSWRKKYITGTEVAVLFGLNPYKKPKDLVCDKFGEGTEFTSTSFVTIGRLLEPLIIQSLNGTSPGSEGTVSVLYDKRSKVSVSLDGMLGDSPLECKCMYHSSYTKKYKGRIPDHYLLQLIMQMRLLGKSKGHFGLLLYVPEHAHRAIESRQFKMDFPIFPLIIESITLLTIEGSFKELHKLIDSEVARFFKEKELYEVDKENKKAVLKILKAIELVEEFDV